MKDKFLLRKLKQLGKKFGFRLIDANQPKEIFIELMKYRDGGRSRKASQEYSFLTYTINHYNQSKAQIFQDLFVLFMSGEKCEGYFVEFGATNGLTLSNSYLLETAFAWNGILAEPARKWHDALLKNRCCAIETQCVWSKSDEQLDFNETPEGELSTIDIFSKADGHSKSREKGDHYKVKTISLNDLLEKHHAPYHIDYLSVDTEGSELSILQHFDFSKYEIKIITVEHNFTADREKIYSLLRSKGYDRVLEKFSQWDDWYIKSKLAE